MSLRIPSGDGELNRYDLMRSGATTPKIYYVNGIRVQGRGHAVIAALLSALTERPINGIYNKTDGAVLDLGQCVLDFLQNSTARLSSHLNLNRSAVPDHQVDRRYQSMRRRSIVWNQATAKLVDELVLHRGRQVKIVAHSQGNLITSNALFVLEDLLGASALRKIRVYSLASPAPAWPLGIRLTHGGGGRQENAFMNDLVALLRPHNLAARLGVGRFQNAGDFRTHPGSGPVSIAPHDTQLNIALNFLQSIRGDLGLSKELPPDFLASAAERAERAIAEVR